MEKIVEKKPIWKPSLEFMEESYMTKYMSWLQEKKNLHYQDYDSLWKWSVENLEEFWGTLWEFFDIKSKTPYEKVLEKQDMPGAQWFTGATLNYAQHIFRNATEKKPALVFINENMNQPMEISWEELYKQTVTIAAFLKEQGVKKGDRVVALMPNIPETIIAFLACSSIGAIWSCCSPDFGMASVIARFQQIEPTILFTVDGYQFNGKVYDLKKDISILQDSLPTIAKTVIISNNKEKTIPINLGNCIHWDQIKVTNGELKFEYVPFDHPLWILYSSGTSGHPKAIVQGHGGIILEHLKTLLLHNNITENDRFFWQTSTSWMVWNITVGSLLTGATTVLYDGSPTYPTKDALWKLCEKTKMTFLGTGAGYLQFSRKIGVNPKNYNLENLKGIGSTGSPLNEDDFTWIFTQFNENVWLVNSSGGTDVCSAFVISNPILPIYSGELQCRPLGVDVQAFNPEGKSLMNEVGELVVTKPIPSMPLYFWNDLENKRYHESYFDMYPGVWRHGDWILINERGGCIIYGRSDSTINRNGVRMGTSEIYRAVESIEEIVESMVVDLEYLGRESYMPMFVVLKEGEQLTESLLTEINNRIKENASPRHVPNQIFQVEQIPKTLNGKKMEVPIRNILLGKSVGKIINPDSMSNPESLPFFIDLAHSLNKKAAND